MSVRGKRSVKGFVAIGLPPDDGREWIVADEGAAMLGCGRKWFLILAKRLDFTGYFPPDRSQKWFVKKEVEWWARFVRDRARWREKRQPKHWEQEMLPAGDEEEARRYFLSSKQVAVMLGVSAGRVARLAKQGKLPVHPTRGTGRGSWYWFAPTAIRYYLENEERQKWRESYAKGKVTRERRLRGLEGKPPPKPKKGTGYRKVPAGWLTAEEAAERLGVSAGAVRRLRRVGRLRGAQFPGKFWSQRPWFYCEVEIDELLSSEDYRAAQGRWKRVKGEAPSLSV